ncbi:MAG TPA: hypothetical protein VMQ93_18705 [Novosphingobium sp.]|nr:hypothetical protein [Novosphingobium sp.]
MMHKTSGEIAAPVPVRRRLPRAMALAGATCAALVLQSPAHAQTLDNKYWLSIMAFYPKVDTNVRVAAEGPNQEVSTDIDFEQDLALDNDEILPSVTAGARFGKVIVGADYYQLKRNGSIELARDIVFDGVTYPTAARVESGFDSDIYRLTVGYAIVRNPSLELGAALGAHVTRFELSIAGEGSVGEQSGQTEVRRRNVLAPLPTVGLFGTWKVAPGLELNARADYLSLKIDDYDGRLVNAQVGANYAIMKNVALGVAYRYVDYRLGIEKERWNGRIRYKLKGPALVLQASF